LIALNEVEVAVIDKLGYMNSLCTFQHLSVKIKTMFFEEYIIREPKLNHLATMMAVMFERKVFPKGYVLIHQGSVTDMIYLISSGDVVIIKNWVERIPKTQPLLKLEKVSHRFQLRTLTKGEMIGEENLWRKRPIVSEFEYETTNTTICYCITIKQLQRTSKESDFIMDLLKSRSSAKLKFIDKLNKIVDSKIDQATKDSEHDFKLSLFKSPRQSKSYLQKKTMLSGILDRTSFKPNKQNKSFQAAPEYRDNVITCDYLNQDVIERSLIKKKGIPHYFNQDLSYLEHFSKKDVIKAHLENTKRIRRGQKLAVLPKLEESSPFRSRLDHALARFKSLEKKFNMIKGTSNHRRSKSLVVNKSVDNLIKHPTIIKRRRSIKNIYFWSMSNEISKICVRKERSVSQIQNI